MGSQAATAVTRVHHYPNLSDVSAGRMASAVERTVGYNLPLDLCHQWDHALEVDIGAPALNGLQGSDVVFQIKAVVTGNALKEPQKGGCISWLEEAELYGLAWPHYNLSGLEASGYLRNGYASIGASWRADDKASFDDEPIPL